MKHLNFTIVSLCLSAFAASAAPESLDELRFNPSDAFSVGTPLFESYSRTPGGRARMAVDDPSDNTRTFNYMRLDGPDGKTWYYTARYDYTRVYFNEYYTETLKTAFTFTFYDEELNRVGQIKDKIRFADDEKWDGNGTYYGRDMECVPASQVTVNFFNQDDKPEIMVYHAMNRLSFINHYYYDVYSIGGEKDREGNDVPIDRIEGRFVESINWPLGDGKENIYLTFTLDPVVDWPLDDPNALEKLHASFFRVTTYKKVEKDGDDIGILITNDIGNTHIPGDTTEGIYYMAKKHDGKLYFIYSQYDKPCFIDPRGGAIDERQTPDNSLKIEVFATEKGETPQEVSTTYIPLQLEDSSEQLIYTFLSIGSVAWREDVDMIVNGTPDAPAFVVKKDVAAAADLDMMLSSFHIYDNAGNLVRTIADNTEAMSLFRMGEFEEPLLMVVHITPNYEYEFNFIPLYSGGVLASIPQRNGGDPLYASCAPIKDANGKYTFAFEMQYFEEDDDYNTLARVAWFEEGGKLKRIDRINLGKDVQASLVNMYREALNPYLFDTDDKMEYAVLVKRFIGETTRNEYMVVDDNGGWYAHFSADDGRGDPYLLTILPGDPNRMVVNFNNGAGLVYDLPFKNPSENPLGDWLNGVEGVEAESAGAARYFNLQGIEIAEPTQGLYIKVQGGKTEKILK